MSAQGLGLKQTLLNVLWYVQRDHAWMWGSKVCKTCPLGAFMVGTEQAFSGREAWKGDDSN